MYLLRVQWQILWEKVLALLCTCKCWKKGINCFSTSAIQCLAWMLLIIVAILLFLTAVICLIQWVWFISLVLLRMNNKSFKLNTFHSTAPLIIFALSFTFFLLIRHRVQPSFTQFPRVHFCKKILLARSVELDN